MYSVHWCQTALDRFTVSRCPASCMHHPHTLKNESEMFVSPKAGGDSQRCLISRYPHTELHDDQWYGDRLVLKLPVRDMCLINLTALNICMHRNMCNLLRNKALVLDIIINNTNQGCPDIIILSIIDETINIFML